MGIDLNFEIRKQKRQQVYFNGFEDSPLSSWSGSAKLKQKTLDFLTWNKDKCSYSVNNNYCNIMNALKPDLLPFLSSLIVTLSDLPVFVNHITKHQPIKVTQSSSSSSFIHLISCWSLLIKLLPHCHFCVIAVFYFHCQYPKRASLFLV